MTHRGDQPDRPPAAPGHPNQGAWRARGLPPSLARLVGALGAGYLVADGGVWRLSSDNKTDWRESGVATHNASVTLDQAQAIIGAARAKADDIGVPMNIAVVDAGNNLTAFSRMDGAWLGSIEIAQSKAYTARGFDMPTRDLAGMAQPGQPLFGIEGSNQGVIIFAGGSRWSTVKQSSGPWASAAARPIRITTSLRLGSRRTAEPRPYRHRDLIRRGSSAVGADPVSAAARRPGVLDVGAERAPGDLGPAGP